MHVDAIGTMALGGAAPMRRDTIFRISSMTKPVTAVAAMILVEECKLRLDEPVDRLLPELAERQVLKSLDSAVDGVESTTGDDSTRGDDDGGDPDGATAASAPGPMPTLAEHLTCPPTTVAVDDAGGLIQRCRRRSPVT